MTRTVKAWAGLSDGELTRWNEQIFGGGLQYDIYPARRLARQEYRHVVPCTITYDNGKKSKAEKGKK